MVHACLVAGSSIILTFRTREAGPVPGTEPPRGRSPAGSVAGMGRLPFQGHAQRTDQDIAVLLQPRRFTDLAALTLGDPLLDQFTLPGFDLPPHHSSSPVQDVIGFVTGEVGQCLFDRDVDLVTGLVEPLSTPPAGDREG
jgi:hypothetical protein